MWRDFPQALSETRGVRQYVTLFEAPFVASALSDHENNALWVGSLLAVPPPALGTQPLAGSMTVDLPGNSLTQWATHIQDVASGMRLPPEVAVNCPQADIVWGVKPAREDDPGAILSPLLWSRPRVWVLQHPSPDSRSGTGIMDAPNNELHGHGLFY